MQIIFDVIGRPDESEIAKFKNEKARNFLHSLPNNLSPHMKKKNLKRMFPKADRYTQDLLKQFLKFDADKRISLEDAAVHPYFTEYKSSMQPDNETKIDKAEGFENVFHFEETEEDKYWRSLILDEVLKYNQDELGRFVLSGTMNRYPVDYVVCGYIREYIEPLFVNVVYIHLDVVDLLCSFF